MIRETPGRSRIEIEIEKTAVRNLNSGNIGTHSALHYNYITLLMKNTIYKSNIDINKNYLSRRARRACST